MTQSTQTTQANPHTPGRFVWHELMTPDIAKSKPFYTQLFGWTVEDMDMGGPEPYQVIKFNDEMVGGFVKPQSEDVPVHWASYVSVEDVDAAAQRAEQHGGQVLHPPMDIPVGRFAVIQDPQGGALALFKAAQGDDPEVEAPKLGTFCWDQLNTTDPKAAGAFYGEVFGWKQESFGDAMTTFKRGERDAASMMAAPDGVPTHWLSYVVVDELEGARDKVPTLGGKVLMDEIPVPGVGRFAVIEDNLGGPLALFEAAPR